MRLLARRTFFIALMLGAMLTGAWAQTVPKQATGVITGRVTLGEKGAPNVAVAVIAPEGPRERGSIAKAVTDYEGRYRLTGVPPGRYNVVAIAPAFVGPNEGMYGDAGKAVTIIEGETVEKVDFPLVRGGVITGRVTDADGAPVIGERVQLNPVGKQHRWYGFYNVNPFMYETDDRGVYRLYGISPGKYTVSLGESGEDGGVRFGFGGRGYYARTFHPDVTEESKATVIEISEGTEASNVNITLGRKSKSFAATGRVVDESGKPVGSIAVGHGTVLKEGNRMGGFGWGTSSDAQGRFRLDGLVPGRYAAFVWPEGSGTEGYSDPVMFEITDGNVSGLELKLRRGSTLSGVLVIEGTGDRAVLAKLSQLSVGIDVATEGLDAPSFAETKVAPDGSFRFAGLRPGKARLWLASYPPPKGFAFARIERDGVAQQEIEITSGTQVSGVRIVIEYGTGVIRGAIKVENGPAPEDTRLVVSASRAGDANKTIRHGAQVDSRGRYVIEGVSPGEYELVLQTFLNNPPPQRRLPPIKQNVIVTNGVEAEANFTVDLHAKPLEGGNK